MSRAYQNRKKALKRWKANLGDSPQSQRVWKQYQWQLRNLPVYARSVPWVD